MYPRGEKNIRLKCSSGGIHYIMHKYTYNALLYHTAVIPVSHQVVGGDMEIVAKYLKLNVRHKTFALLYSEYGQLAEIIALHL